ncbi:MAG: hypothetical protein ACRD6N_14995 [Pyrinomonadaceae bacterium]
MTAEAHATQIKAELGNSWLPHIYRDRVLKMRTRSYHFESLKRNVAVKTQHSLLGVELKIGNRRVLCPDLATARYLAVFARVGCSDVAVPYDITKVSQLADELESSWYRMLLLAEHNAAERSDAFRARIRGLLVAKLRREISELGAGARMPEFKQSTKQRR